MGRRRRARECALQLLYEIDMTDVEPSEIYDQFWDGKEAEKAVREFSEGLVDGVFSQRTDLDREIAAVAKHWRLDRMAVVDRNVLRMALFEMQRDTETPAAVVIDEAIEIARRFGSEESAQFVNGVLDAVRRATKQ